MNLRDDQKLQIQQATDIVRLIGEQVALRPRGREFIGICPFHDDKNPSLYISPGKQIYKCFSCGAGGDAFSFVMAYHKMTFPEALAHLAERAGIKLQPRAYRGGGGAGQSEESGPTDRQMILQANAQAAAFYQALLKHGEHGQAARGYVARRGISAQMVQEFQIGYAPDRWDGLVLMAQEKGWNARGLELSGLITPRANSSGGSGGSGGFGSFGGSGGAGHYDRFRHRLMFPICDALGRPIALGGRKLREEDEPKYLNSPESPAFNKSATLYGLHLAKKAIIDSRVAVIVEGYTDVIACHQAGARNVVATLGTALTPQHVTELRRYCEKVVLIYDGDAAGIKASDRAVEIMLAEQLDVEIAIIPDDLDPADLFVKPDGLARWEAVQASAKDALEYQYRRIAAQFAATKTITGRQKLIDTFLDGLTTLGLERQSISRRGLVIQRLADLFHMDSRDVNRRITKTIQARKDQAAMRAGKPFAPAEPSEEKSPFVRKAEKQAHRMIIACLVRQPSLFMERNVDEELAHNEVSGDEGHLYGMICDRLNQGRDVTLQGLLADLAETGLHELAALLTNIDAHLDDVCNFTTFDVAGHLQSYLDAARFMRDEREYLQTKVEMAEQSRQGTISGDKFLEFVCRFMRAHPYSGRFSEAQRDAAKPVSPPDRRAAFDAEVVPQLQRKVG